MTEWVSKGRADGVSSVRVELRGAHAHVSVFFRGTLSGVLVVGEDEAGALERALLGDQGAHGYPCPHCGWLLSVCERHGPYTRTDENQCGACRRGE